MAKLYDIEIIEAKNQKEAIEALKNNVHELTSPNRYVAFSATP